MAVGCNECYKATQQLRMHRQSETRAGNDRRHTRTRNASLPTQANHSARGARKQPPQAGRNTCSCWVQCVALLCFRHPGVHWVLLGVAACLGPCSCAYILCCWSVFVGRLSVLECAFWGVPLLFALLHLFPPLRPFVTVFWHNMAKLCNSFIFFLIYVSAAAMDSSLRPFPHGTAMNCNWQLSLAYPNGYNTNRRKDALSRVTACTGYSN